MNSSIAPHPIAPVTHLHSSRPFHTAIVSRKSSLCCQRAVVLDVRYARTLKKPIYSRRKWKWHSRHVTCGRVAWQWRYRYPCLLCRHDDIFPITISLHGSFRRQDRHNSVFGSNVTCVRGEKLGARTGMGFRVDHLPFSSFSLFGESELLFRSRYFGEYRIKIRKKNIYRDHLKKSGAFTMIWRYINKRKFSWRCCVYLLVFIKIFLLINHFS